MGCAASTPAADKYVKSDVESEQSAAPEKKPKVVVVSPRSQAETEAPAAAPSPAPDTPAPSTPAAPSSAPVADADDSLSAFDIASVQVQKTRSRFVPVADVWIAYDPEGDASDFADSLRSELASREYVAKMQPPRFKTKQAEVDALIQARQSLHVVLVLSSHVLEYAPAKAQVLMALSHQVPVWLITYQGARWGDKGQHDFPPMHLQPIEIRGAFANVSVDYMRNAHDAAMNQLVGKLKPPQVKKHKVMPSPLPEQYEVAPFFQALVESPDHGEAEFARFLLVAECTGDAAAQYMAGMMFLSGYGVSRNVATAVEWLRRALVQGHEPSRVAMGRLLQYGVGVAKDEVAAFQHFEQAAAAGNMHGKHLRAECLDNGIGTAKDEAAALKCFEEAANGGSLLSMRMVGQSHEYGKRGLSSDRPMSIKWYLKGAERGHALCMWELYYAYRNNLGGLPKNLALAMEWLTKSTNKSAVVLDGQCFDSLGGIFSNGLDAIPVDRRKALGAFIKAWWTGKRAQASIKQLQKQEYPNFDFE